MNAVVKPKWRRLKTELVEDVKFGAPLETLRLEADECVTWADEEGQGELFAHHFLDGVAEIWDKDFDPNVRKRFDDLCKKVMDGTISADELIEWRDIQRAAVIDYFSAWARNAVEQELPL